MKIPETQEMHLAIARALVVLDNVETLNQELYTLAMTTEQRRGAGIQDMRSRSEYMCEEIAELLQPFIKTAYSLRQALDGSQAGNNARYLVALLDKIEKTGQDNKIERFEP